MPRKNTPTPVSFISAEIRLLMNFMQLRLPLNFQEDRENQLPHIVLSHEFIGEDLIPRHWELNIPEQFTTSVFLSAIKGYLSYCEQNQILPFKPESERAYRFSWYSKWVSTFWFKWQNLVLFAVTQISFNSRKKHTCSKLFWNIQLPMSRYKVFTDKFMT